MTYRSDLPFWQVPLSSFQEFDHGAEIEARIPASWNLNIGDCLEYEIGDNISGIAEVVRVGNQPVDAIENSEVVPGVVCVFKKII